MFKLVLEKVEEQEIKLPTSARSWEKEESSRNKTKQNIYFYFINYAFDCVDHNKLWKILKEMKIHTTWSASWETNMQVRKQKLLLDMEQQTGSK